MKEPQFMVIKPGLENLDQIEKQLEQDMHTILPVHIESVKDEAYYKALSNMTKEEAKEAMKLGLKVTHEYFGQEEWMSMKDGDVITEEGYRIDEYEWWRWRTSPWFDDGYTIWKQPTM